MTEVKQSLQTGVHNEACCWQRRTGVRLQNFVGPAGLGGQSFSIKPGYAKILGASWNDEHELKIPNVTAVGALWG
jgi:hypothetical protein